MQFSQAFDPIRSLKAAWKLLLQAPVTVLIGGLLLGFLEGNGGGGLNFFFRGNELREFPFSRTELERAFEAVRPWLLLLIPFVLCVGLALFALSSWIEVGFARAIESGLRTGRDEIGKVFSGGDRFGAMLLARFFCLLIHLALAIPMIAAAVVVVFLTRSAWPEVLGVLTALGLSLIWLLGTIYIGLGLYMVKAFVAFESCTPTEALSRSWKLARGNRLQLFWFVLLQILLGVAGICACCIGVFVTIPLTRAMRYEAYLALTRGEQFPQWWIGTGRFPFDEHKPEDFGSPRSPPPVPPPLPPQT